MHLIAASFCSIRRSIIHTGFSGSINVAFSATAFLTRNPMILEAFFLFLILLAVVTIAFLSWNRRVNTRQQLQK
jgi:hypothetical protein